MSETEAGETPKGTARSRGGDLAIARLPDLALIPATVPIAGKVSRNDGKGSMFGAFAGKIQD